MRQVFDFWKGSKTYLQLIVMAILVIVEQTTGAHIPDMVYQLLGLGAGVTAKMAIDRMVKDNGNNNN